MFVPGLAPLHRPHSCSSCGVDEEELGDNGISCRFSKGHQSRHAALNDVIKRELESVEVPAIWSKPVCTAVMVGDPMVHLWCYGQGVGLGCHVHRYIGFISLGTCHLGG